MDLPFWVKGHWIRVTGNLPSRGWRDKDGCPAYGASAVITFDTHTHTEYESRKGAVKKKKRHNGKRSGAGRVKEESGYGQIIIWTCLWNNIAQPGIELSILLPLPTEFWNCRHALPHLDFLLLVVFVLVFTDVWWCFCSHGYHSHLIISLKKCLFQLRWSCLFSDVRLSVFLRARRFTSISLPACGLPFHSVDSILLMWVLWELWNLFLALSKFNPGT